MENTLINDEQKAAWAKTYESHYENQFNITKKELKIERNKRILKEGEVQSLFQQLERANNLLNESKREIRDLKSNNNGTT